MNILQDLYSGKAKKVDPRKDQLDIYLQNVQTGAVVKIDVKWLPYEYTLEAVREDAHKKLDLLIDALLTSKQP